MSALKIGAALSNHLRFGSEPICINGAAPSASVNWAACYQFIGAHQPSAAAGTAGGTQLVPALSHRRGPCVAGAVAKLHLPWSAERLLEVAGWVRSVHNHSLLPPQHESSPGPSCYSRCHAWGLLMSAGASASFHTMGMKPFLTAQELGVFLSLLPGRYLGAFSSTKHAD